jgi:hypothetical protein
LYSAPNLRTVAKPRILIWSHGGMEDIKNAHKILRKSQWKKGYLSDIDTRLQTETGRVIFHEAPNYLNYIVSLCHERNVQMEYQWHDIDREMMEYYEKKLFQAHFVLHKCYGDWPGIKPVPAR